MKKANAIVGTTEELYAEYKANEVAADGKYKNQVLEVTGVVKQIGKDILDAPYIAFKLEENQFMTSVQASFPSSASSQLAQLSKGQRVTVRGRCSGFTIGTVMLKDCVLK